MKQGQTTGKIKTAICEANFTSSRLIKIHGGKYQESGLPDLMIFVTMNNVHLYLWLEIKRDWADYPSAIQQYNIKDLRRRGWITGYVVGDEYKEDFSMPTSIKLKSLFSTIISNYI